MPMLKRSVILPHDKPVNENLEVARAYTAEELAKGRMSGLLSCIEMEAICCGPFCSPLIVITQD